MLNLKLIHKFLNILGTKVTYDGNILKKELNVEDILRHYGV